jgi:hypothetical protein
MLKAARATATFRILPRLRGNILAIDSIPDELRMELERKIRA